jgi:hypothetical protein
VVIAGLLRSLARQADAEVTTDWPRGEVVCYPKSRGGLFAGVSLERAWLQVDSRGNEAFAGKHSEDDKVALDLLTLELLKFATPPPPPPPPKQPPLPRKRGAKTAP